jgi:hypothetical protein
VNASKVGPSAFFMPALPHPTQDLLVVATACFGVFAVILTIIIRNFIERPDPRMRAKDIPSSSSSSASKTRS